MSASDEFTKLKEQVEKADRDIRAAVAEDDAKLNAMVDELRKKDDDRTTQLRAKSAETGDEAKHHWDEVKRNWDEHRQRVRKHLDETKATIDAKAAAEDAEWAETDAVGAIEFAQSATEDAQYAVLEAVRARRKADIAAAAM